MGLLLLIAVVCTSLGLLGAAAGQPVQFIVTNQLAGKELGCFFDWEFGESYARGLMENASRKVWQVMGITDPYNAHTNVTLFVTKDLNNAYGRGWDGQMWIDMDLMADFLPQERRSWLEAVVFHEMTHAWQAWGPTPSRDDTANLTKQLGIQEGMAEFVVLVGTTFSNPGCVGWMPSWRDHWYDGYCKTALFFRYLTTINPTFVADLNRKLVLHGYREGDFGVLLGTNKTVNQLWLDFRRNFKPPKEVAGGGKASAAVGIPSQKTRYYVSRRTKGASPNIE